MSAALCGPSNALSSLQKHTSTDRSLQQDRFQNHAGPHQQGFRSGPSQGNGWIENEFEQFSAQRQPISQTLQPSHFAGGLSAEPSHDWATDFQRLNIEPAFRFHPSQQSLPQANASGWHTEFALQHQPLQHHVRPSLTPESVSNNQNIYMSSPSQLGYSQFPQAPVYNAAPMQQKQATEFQFDESAFEKAFEQAAREVESLEPDVVVPEVVAEEPKTQEEPKPEHDPVKESDDLARTAGQLLDSVREDSSTKFQQSNFLALMRRLRDREVVVEGDKMVEVR